MSDWSLEDEEQFDFMDPQDPTASPEPDADGSALAPAHDAAADAAIDPELGEGVSDPKGAVHVWFDDDQRVVHVRVSNRWRERLKGDSFAETALRVVARNQPRGGAQQEQGEPAEAIEPRILDTTSVDRLLERTLELDDRLRKLQATSPDQLEASRFEGQKASGTSGNRQVTVGLTLFGDTERLSVEDEWLSSAKAESIGAAIVEAHADAYAKYTAPTYVMGDYTKLAQERRLLVKETTAMLQRGPRW